MPTHKSNDYKLHRPERKMRQKYNKDNMFNCLK